MSLCLGRNCFPQTRFNFSHNKTTRNFKFRTRALQLENMELSEGKEIINDNSYKEFKLALYFTSGNISVVT